MLRNSKLCIVASGLALILLIAIGCERISPPPPGALTPLPPQTIAPRMSFASRWLMDWDAASRKTWYLTPQGSLIMPMDIFMALKTADGKRLFSSRENLQQYGWIYPPDSDASQLTMNGLPLGFVQEPNADMNKVMTFGLTCGACHTGQLIFNNTRYVVDGAAPLSDIQEWDIDMAAALGKVVSNPQQLLDLQKAIATRNPQSPYATNMTQLQSDLNTVYLYLDGRAQRNVPSVNYGWGRLDAFTIIANEVLVHDAQLNERDAQGKYLNNQVPGSPVSYPYLWDVPNLECVQTNCLAQEPMTRNLGETLGVYGHIRLRVLPDSPTYNFSDLGALATIGDELNFSADPNKLYTLEHQLTTLPAPKWQNEFGALNPDLVKRGAAIFDNAVYNVEGIMMSCASCHVHADKANPASLTPPTSDGHQFFKVTRWAPTVTGTDMTFLNNQTPRTVTGLTPLLAGVYDTIIYDNQPLIERFTDPQKKYALDFLALVTGLAMKKWYAVNNVDAAGQLRYRENHPIGYPTDLFKYKARPLDGIAFTAPYLHNGSVPSLQQLLTKPADRVKTFNLGSLSWDPQAVGYKGADSEYYDYPKFTFDTSLQGNYNTGHDWGTELSDADKQALIEYLKSQ